MIKYTQWGKHLRIGNFWFLWNTLNHICEKTGHELVLPEYFAWEHMNYPPIIDNNKDFDELFHFRTTAFSKEELDWTINWFNERKDKVINVNLGANCQSALWWEDSDYVLDKMQFKAESIEDVLFKYEHILANGRETIGVGVRLGDFLGHNCFYQIPFNWYLDAIKSKFDNWENYNILIMSDDIEKAKTLFKGDNIYFAEPNGTHTHADNFKHYHSSKAMEQFILGTLCNHMIIGNSTFSWHQAYYVDKFNNGRVIHSNRNLDNECLKQFYNPDYYPKNWEIHEIKKGD